VLISSVTNHIPVAPAGPNYVFECRITSPTPPTYVHRCSTGSLPPMIEPSVLGCT